MFVTLRFPQTFPRWSVPICSAFLYLVVLWAFAARVLPNGWSCFLKLHVFVLGSLGHYPSHHSDQTLFNVLWNEEALTSQNMGSFLAKSTTRVMAGVIIFVNWLKASMSTLLPSGVLMMGAEPMSSGCNDRKGRGIELSNTGTYRKWTITETKVWHSKSSFPSKARRRPEIQQDMSSKQAWSPVIKREKRKDEKLKLEEDQSREASLISPSVGSLLTRVIHWYLNVISYFIFYF